VRSKADEMASLV